MFSPLLFSISEQFLSFDLGSQYLKAASGQNNGEVNPYKLGRSKNPIPLAFAFKTKADPKKHLELDQFNSTTFKIGNPAVQYLRSRPNSGFEYVMNNVERSRNEFTTSKYATGLEALGLYFQELFKKVPKPSAIALVHPAYFSPKQNLAIQNAARLSGANIGGLYEDESAMAIYYSDMMLDRFRNKPRHVLFIDVGATSASAYTLNFTWEEDKTFARETGYGWTEKTGGYHFAKALAESVRIPLADAQKLLLQSPEGDFASQPISELEKLIKTVLSQSDGKIDEIQLIGGASRFSFVIDAVRHATEGRVALRPIKKAESQEEGQDFNTNHNKMAFDDDDLKINIDPTASSSLGLETPKATNETNTSAVAEEPNILQDFDPDMALSLAAMHAFLFSYNMSNYYPAYIEKKPHYSLYAKMGNQREKFCQKRSLCRPITVQGKGEETLSVEVDEGTQPFGLSKTFATYKLVNITNMTYPDEFAQGRIEFQYSEPRLSGVFWCNKERCFPINVTEATIDDEFKGQFNFALEFAEKKRNYERRNLLIKVIEERLPKAKRAMEGEQINRIRDLSDEEVALFNKVYDQFQGKKYLEMENTELEQILKDIQPIGEALGFKWN